MGKNNLCIHGEEICLLCRVNEMDNKQEIRRLKAQGLSYRQVQKELGLSSVSIVQHHLKDTAFDRGVKAGKLEVLKDLMEEVNELNYWESYDREITEDLINQKIEAISGKDDK